MKSREDLLSYRSKGSIKNTLLHEAIVDNNHQLAINYVNMDIKANDGQTIINEVSLYNTPLILALKKGNIEVASIILEHPLVDVNIKDKNGMTALHWACLLRQDKIIDKLLHKGAKPNEVAQVFIGAGRREHNLFAISLYQKVTSQAALEGYAKYDPYGDAFIDNNEKKAIIGAPGYIDIIYHMADICNNLNWCTNNTRFIDENDQSILQSKDRFRENFKIGIPLFCNHRNAIPINSEIEKKLQVVHLNMEDKGLSVDKKIVSDSAPTHITFFNQPENESPKTLYISIVGQNRVLPITINPQATVEDLTNEIIKVLGIKKENVCDDNFKLIFSGKTLKGDQKLTQTNICYEINDPVYLVLSIDLFKDCKPSSSKTL